MTFDKGRYSLGKEMSLCLRGNNIITTPMWEREILNIFTSSEIWRMPFTFFIFQLKSQVWEREGE
jgi:hypothetical protein